MSSPESVKKAWSEEYKRKGIPSSFRKDPTKTLVEFMYWWKRKNYPLRGIAADIGCGLGRNSFYLASLGFAVYGLDLLEENVRQVNEVALDKKLPVQAFAHDVSTDWPVDSHAFDVVIDVFCYKHILTKEKQAIYRQQLWRALKPQGIYFISLASENDGFYGPCLNDAIDRKTKQIVDPFSKIPSFLYSLNDLKNEFSDLFEPLELDEQRSKSPMYEKEYSRAVINGIFTKRH